MTKVGENNQPPKIPTEQSYHKDLESGTQKFQTALESYSLSTDNEDRTRLRAFMDNQLQLIQSAVNEIKLKEIHKQSEKIAKDYDQYMQSNNEENFAALEHDIQTLRDYNQISTPQPKQGL